MAYTTATLVAKDIPLEDGRVRITIEFTGSGETAKRLSYTVGANDTLQSIRQWVIGQAANLGSVKTVADSLTVGQSLSLTPITPPAPTAVSVWAAKVNRLRAVAGLTLTGTAATERDALLADVNATYQAGFI